MPQIKPLQPFSLFEQLVGLHAKNFKSSIESIHHKGRSEADWIVGLKKFADTQALHGHFWEKHPKGDETILLITGTLELCHCDENFQQVQRIQLHAEQSIVIPANTWHRFEVIHAGSLLFMTPAQGSKIEKVANHHD
ncbi:cupin domain-containing protein [Acinetobacter larvae]|uniref:Cupin type-2 domain-containing protein n=1 Tax=Acinetobacter larvae TaxID=1789224 RepID=A0A1B2LY00_9GAMM|nr:cupin domain-containing protein [Acinetobacter larvae]AOA57828.1 hypothetical protein BFG52_05320 [Acinetobacter larvae]